VKRNLIFWLGLILGLLVASPLAAQKPEAKRGAYLIVAGGGGACKGAFQFESPFISYDYVGQGLSLGLGLGFPVVAKWGVFAQTELRYSQKRIGAPWNRYWGGPVGATYTLVHRNDYLELPVLLRKNLTLGHYVTAYALAGPVVSLRNVGFEAYLHDYSYNPPPPTIVTPAMEAWALRESEYKASNSRALPNQRVGWLVGIGALAQLGQRHQVGLEFRHHQAHVFPEGRTDWLNLKNTTINLVYQINLGK
jgi:hypothetical protein